MTENTGFVFVVMAAVAILIGLAFLPSISPEIGKMTQTYTSLNTTITLPAVTATSEIPSCGQRVVTNLGVVNSSSGVAVPATNYTVSQSTGTDGYLAAKITTASQSAYAGRSVNVSCVYEPKGYVSESGGRAIVGLIAIAFGLLILVAALPNVRGFIGDLIKG